MKLCNNIIFQSGADAATAFKGSLGDPNANPPIASTGSVTAYAFQNSQTGDFNVRAFTTPNLLPYPQFAIEHVFEFQIMGRFFAVPANKQAYCGFVTPGKAEFQNIVDIIDNISNLVYAYGTINDVKLQVVKNNNFGISSLEAGFVAPSQYDSATFNTLSDPKAVAGRKKAQMLLRSSGGLINYLNANAAIFKNIATQIKTKLGQVDQNMANAFDTWLQQEVGDYQNRAKTKASALAANYQFQLSTRTGVTAPNGFNAATMQNTIANSFPTLQTAAMLP
ncbi:hypothetical protein C8R44DRAFT_794309 [Mycena epipterygia]|nr:hypothetical protein C8R44DRAFT_794309 [Mycena epipterygia]